MSSSNLQAITREILALLEQLQAIVDSEGASPQLPGISIAIRRIGSASEAERLEALRDAKSILLTLSYPKAPLAEFFVWRDDYEERLKANHALEAIRDRLTAALDQIP